MKAKMFFIAILACILLNPVELFAQRGRTAPGRHPQGKFTERPAERTERPARDAMEYCLSLPDLTEEQQEAIREVRLKQIESSTKHRTEMEALRASKRSLMRGVSEGDVNEVIDKMTALRNTQMKSNVAHHQAIRELLTEEQRILFDSRVMRRPGGRSASDSRGVQSPRMGRGRW